MSDNYEVVILPCADVQALKLAYIDLSGFEFIKLPRVQRVSHVAALRLDEEVVAALSTLDIDYDLGVLSFNFFEVRSDLRGCHFSRPLVTGIFEHAAQFLPHEGEKGKVFFNGFTSQGQQKLQPMMEDLLDERFSNCLEYEYFR